jgi:predicted nuclease of predicted toxin-antitoxin system
MRPFDLSLFADENIPQDLISRLRDQGKDVRSVHQEGLVGATDIAILEHARSQNRVLLTHDSDFGQLAIHAGQPYFGIVYLRPGHISADFTWKTILAIQSTVESVEPPFIVVAEQRGVVVRIRVRSVSV